MGVSKVNKQYFPDSLKVGIAQIAPVWLDRAQTINKIVDYVNKAADQGCALVAFGEALLPGYPFWIELTDGARFNSSIQKEMHAHYLQQAVQIETGDLKPLCDMALKRGIAIYIGCIERAVDRGGHSLYCSLVYIDAQGIIQSTHRKLMPTYEERLTWAQGDGHGLRVHKLSSFTVGGLNCWENWMPLSRAALYAQGEDLHVAVWPGNEHNTIDITRYVAKESRSYVISASAVMRKTDFPVDTPHIKIILDNSPDVLANGGSCIAGPDGAWLVEPIAGAKEQLIVAVLDHRKVREERQNFDPSGHYSRPDVTRLTINRERQSILGIVEQTSSTSDT
jgi:nitrilase